MFDTTELNSNNNNLLTWWVSNKERKRNRFTLVSRSLLFSAYTKIQTVHQCQSWFVFPLMTLMEKLAPQTIRMSVYVHIWVVWSRKKRIVRNWMHMLYRCAHCAVHTHYTESILCLTSKEKSVCVLLLFSLPISCFASFHLEMQLDITFFALKWNPQFVYVSANYVYYVSLFFSCLTLKLNVYSLHKLFSVSMYIRCNTLFSLNFVVVFVSVFMVWLEYTKFAGFYVATI